MTGQPSQPSIDLYALSKDDLAQLLRRWGEAPFRANQIWDWLYGQRVLSFSAMLNLPKSLRTRLEAEATLGTLQIVAEQESVDGTVKRLYRLHDGRQVESVLMPYADGRRTACISTQAGCAMGCVFCATGQMGFARNLSSTEIYEQAHRYAADLAARGERLSNVVLMGMGEPLHNYDATVSSIRRLMSDLGIGARRITVSTVGLVPQILRFAEEGLQVTLAISLHAATDEARSALLPVNRRWPLESLLDAANRYVERTGRRITFEWALIAGKNDTPTDAEQLAHLVQGLLCHVNLIPLNPTHDYDGTPTDGAAAKAFVRHLETHGVPATIRIRRGIDIDAGCGQLRSAITRQDGSSAGPTPPDNTHEPQ